MPFSDGRSLPILWSNIIKIVKEGLLQVNWFFHQIPLWLRIEPADKPSNREMTSPRS
jgi:hypothetical protein